MNQHQAEQFIISLTNIGRKEYLLDKNNSTVYLKRLQFFLDLLGNPEKKIPHYIHVTGTSGKGSVCLMLDSILRADKKKVGVLTSPHASVIQERWAVNGKNISGKEFAETVTEIKNKLDEYIRTSPYDMISYYETMTAIALYYFAKKKVEWAVLEVGCGGRLDSTNIIPYKDVAVITNVGLDHTDILGNTKEKIAFEKAGIIKSGCRVFTGIKEKRLIKIIEKECKKTKTRFEISNFKFKILKQFSNNLISNNQQIIGKHQVANAQLCTDIAKYLKISDKTIATGLKKIKLPIRMEVVSKNPLIILDGAHNPDKMRTTVATIKNLKSEIKNLQLVVGFSANKNINKMIKQLASLKPASVACTRYTINPFRKVANPREIANQFKFILPSTRAQAEGSDSRRKTKIEMFLDPKDALEWSKKQNKNSGLILATGSIFLSGEIKNLL